MRALVGEEGQIGVGKAKEPDILDFAGVDKRHAEIGALLAMTKAARDDAIKLGLKFEAYLLDMAVVALAEQSEKAKGS